MRRFVWAVTANGRRMPLDAMPDEDGTMYLLAQAGDDGVEVLDEPMLALDHRGLSPAVLAAKARGDPKWIAHWATCPQAAQHRRRA